MCFKDYEFFYSSQEYNSVPHCSRSKLKPKLKVSIKATAKARTYY